MKQKLLVIAGPTGVGKSELSIEVAKKINGEIISADSMQIYKHMDVGSAKITKDEMLGVQHYMIDVVLPSEEFSVSDFKDGGISALNDILQKNKMPIIVGGTGLYINALTCNMNFSETDKDDNYRLELQRLVVEKGNVYVHDMLKDIDPTSFNEIHANNVKRVIRALEVYRKTGKPFSSYNAGEDLYKSEYDIHFFVLTMDRNKLYKQINKRVDLMMENGLLDECIKLKEMGYNSVMQSMQGIGYKELLFYLEGKISLKEAIEMIKQGSRNYAKRQLTWFRRDPRAIFIDKDINTTSEIVAKIIDDMS